MSAVTCNFDTVIDVTASPQPVTLRRDTVRISWCAYLRTMAQIAWACLRYPHLDTRIDAETGRVIGRH